MSAARETGSRGHPQVLVVEPDVTDRDRLGAWLESSGFEVLFCPGPRPPEYTCVGGRGEPCPLANAADVVVLSLDLPSEAMAEGTASSQLLGYYTGLGKPVVVFGPYKRVARDYADSGVRPISWPVRREELVRAVARAVAREP